MTMQNLKRQAFGRSEEINYYKVLKHYKLLVTHSRAGTAHGETFRGVFFNKLTMILKFGGDLSRNWVQIGLAKFLGRIFEIQYMPQFRVLYDQKLLKVRRLWGKTLDSDKLPSAVGPQ